MEILLLGIYSVFVWLIFFKFKWLPWNIVSQVIVITLPIIGLTALILLLNIVAPSSHDVRVVNYVVVVNARVNGPVTEVPVEPNRPLKKGDLLFRIDRAPYESAVQSAEAKVLQAKAKLVDAQSKEKEMFEQQKITKARINSVDASLALANRRVGQYETLVTKGAGRLFELEQAETNKITLETDMDGALGRDANLTQKLAARLPDGELADIVAARGELAAAEAQLANARWELEQTEYRAPANGTVVSLALRPGAMAVPLPMVPAMTFVEDDQWIMAIYNQNEVRKVKPGQEAEIAMKMYPGRIIKCKVDSIMWATAQGQLPIGDVRPTSTAAGVAPIPKNSLAVRLVKDGRDKDLFLASGALGMGAIYTDSGAPIHILRKVILRIGTKIDWLILKLH
jgi:multidrug resistance efflux pump